MNPEQIDESAEYDISIVIVNYNVKERVQDLLHSVSASKGDYSIETFVVDNNSSDGSVEYLRPLFPDVNFIANKENFGFGIANNQAIRNAKGKYCLLVNPDVILEPDTLHTMYTHMESNTETGAAGCKLLNPDGSFAPESRRSVPTPLSALWKITGLSTLFPKSKVFGRYNLGWMPEDESSSVPVLSGSFMFFRTSVLKEIEGFDERFFMYGEDIDICYRTTKAGYKIDYVAETSVVHYKGESTKKENLDYHVIFNKAMYQFFEKHYGKNHTFIFRFVILTALFLKVMAGYTFSIFRRSKMLFQDLFLINAILIASLVVRLDAGFYETINNFDYRFLVVNFLFSVSYILTSVYYDIFNRNKKSYIDSLKAVVVAFTVVVLITFFFRDFAFSRWIIIMSTAASVIAILFTRYFWYNIFPDNNDRRVLIIGADQHIRDLIDELRKSENTEISGILIQNDVEWQDMMHGIPVIGRVDFTARLTAYHKVNQLYFSVPALSNSEILEQLIEIYDNSVAVYVVPPTINYEIGRSRVRFFGNVPLIEKELSYNRRWNRFLKRSMDILISLPALVYLLPVLLYARLFKRKKFEWYTFRGSNDFPFQVPLFPAEHSVINLAVLLFYVIAGRFSLVGAPLSPRSRRKKANYKQGLTGFIQTSRMDDDAKKQQEEMFYLQNYSIWQDISVLAQTIFFRIPTIKTSLKANGPGKHDES